ncbi:V-type ATP synthase subunit F [Embleya sp. NBC_00896]|uniref:V-type ATP synthase subunit F n=1 Tax=Embleya sp. NBC_00896 TaxID=2975961 RepID=UPI002F915CFD|nr:V-type ATP synthase subunit F [Embleya sp. NBC_00896]
MGTVAAIGEYARVAGLALAGVDVRIAEDPSAVRAVWRELTPGVELVVLTEAAAEALAEDLADDEGTARLVAVMPR